MCGKLCAWERCDTYIWLRFAKEWLYRTITPGSTNIERQIKNAEYLFEKLSCMAYLFI